MERSGSLLLLPLRYMPVEFSQKDMLTLFSRICRRMDAAGILLSGTEHPPQKLPVSEPDNSGEQTPAVAGNCTAA